MMTLYTQTSDASAVYRESTGTLVARDGASAGEPTLQGSDESSTAAQRFECVAAGASTTVYVEYLVPAYPA